MSSRRKVRAALSKMTGFIPERDRKDYDTSRFYLKSTDQRGHRETIRASLPPADFAMLTELVGSGLFPYRSYADVIRDAIHHRCYFLLDSDNIRSLVPAILDNLAKTEALEIVETRKRDLQFYTRLKAEVRSVLNQIDQMDMPEWVAKQMLDDIVEQAQQIREPLRGRMLAFLAESGGKRGLKSIRGGGGSVEGSASEHDEPDEPEYDFEHFEHGD